MGRLTTEYLEEEAMLSQTWKDRRREQLRDHQEGCKTSPDPAPCQEILVK
jgi:hypothetical protein